MNLTTSENPFTNYLNEHLNTLRFYILNTLNTPSEEDIHQLRVEVKKINALLRMFEVVNVDLGDNNLKKSLSKIFKVAGKIREKQIMNGLADAYGLELWKEFEQIRRRKELKQISKLKVRLQSFYQSDWDVLRLKLINIALKKQPEEVEKSALQFLKAEFETILTLHSDKHEEKILHRIRRHLKASGYIISMNSDQDIATGWKEYYEQIKITESLIGDWHDRVDFRNQLLKISEQVSGTTEEDKINSVVQVLEEDINEAITAINRHLSLVLGHHSILG
jgi:CHAD domain-containing protein